MTGNTDVQETPGLVSVVTAAYNMGHYLAETLDSVLGQSYTQVEAIVVDDGSTDDTPAVLARYADDPRVRVIRQQNAGQTVAKNRGVAAARGEFIAFCDADDVWVPDKLALQIPRFADRRVGVVFGDIACIDDKGEPLDLRSSIPWEGNVTAQLLIDNFVPFPTAVVRAAVIREFGGFDESLTMSIDYDLWLRISTRYEFALVRRALAHYRLWPGQMSHRTGERLDNFDRLLERFLAANPGVCTRREEDRARGHLHVTRGLWHMSQGRRLAAWREYMAALRRDALSRRTWFCVGVWFLGRPARS